MAITIQTFNEFLGALIRKIVADAPVNDINDGSVLLTLLEAVASNDFENNAAILSVLDLLNIDVLKNNDLDARAADFGLTRITAQKASGLVTIKDTRITKSSTGLYPVKPAPISGSTVLYVNNAAGWTPTGTLYLGRGTPNFEGPINYSSITSFGTFYTIQLSTALKNDHLISDVVVAGQGTTDRKVGAGTQVKIPANNLNPEVVYSLLRDAIIPAGEDTVTGVAVVAQQAGSLGNAGIGTITNFVSPPFSGATITNSTAFNNGGDVETDIELRQRIKSYSSTLARGTSQAILSAIIGVSDPDDSKQVASAVITEPAVPGDPSIIYLDDGGGFEPSFSGQSVDVLLSGASGKEEFLQLSNYPLPRPQAVNTADGPYELVDGMAFRVAVDGNEEEIFFFTSQFLNITAATLPEIVSAINDQSVTFKARLASNSTRLLIYPIDHSVEVIQVSGIRSTDTASSYANNILKFPNDEFSYIKLYQNNVLLHEKQKSASLTTTPFITWNVTADSDIVISVDGTPTQDRTFTAADFGGASYASLTLNNWVTAFNTKFAGLQAVATPSGSMLILSNKEGSSSSIEVLSGSLFSKWFADLPTTSAGQDSNFHLNRQTGNLQIVTKINPGDQITAGTADAKGTAISSVTVNGTYNLSVDSNNRPSVIVEVSDASSVKVRPITLPIGSTVTVSSPASNTMRIMASGTTTFKFVQPLDFVYISNRGDISGTSSGSWLDIADCGLFKVVGKGGHTSAGTDTYIDVENPNTITGTYTVAASEDIQAFSSDVYPQIWQGALVDTPAAESIQGTVDSFNSQLSNITASIFKTNSIKLASTTENGGSIALPVSVGLSTLLFTTGLGSQRGNPPHVASVKPLQDAYTTFQRQQPTNTGVWLDGRYAYADVKGSISTVATPLPNNISNPYGEEIQSTGVLNLSKINYDSILAFGKGSNKGHHRSLRAVLTLDTVGTQHSKPTTVMDYVPGDEFTVFRPLEISSDDSIVFILDQDAVAKTISIPMSRTGRVNTNFPLTQTGFSADDADNEPGINFSSLQVWGTSSNGTEFKDYTVWFRAHNWYASGGVGSGNGAMIIRAKEFGPAGENTSFRIEYPTFPNQTNSTSHQNTPGGTLTTYVFASKTARAIGIATGLQFQVSSLGNNQWRYTFLGSINLTPVQVGDILGIASTAGVSAANSGTFGVVAKGVSTIDVYNPNGAPTGVGAAEQVQVQTVADVVGTSTQTQVACVAESAGNLHLNHFTLYDDAGIVAFWFDVNNTGAATPTVAGAIRYVKIATVQTSDSANTVASKVAAIISNDSRFTATVATNVVTVTDRFHGPTSNGTTNVVSMTVTQSVTGTSDDSVDGEYFTLYDANGSVAVWYAVNSITPEPLHGASRSIRVSTVVAGDSANTVASKTAAVMASDHAFTSVTASTNNITITDAVNGPRSAPGAGTSGFTMSVVTHGSNPGNEIIGQTASFNVFPLDKTAVSDIVASINSGKTMIAVASGNATLTITKATREEVYTPTGVNYSTSLSYGHNPNPLSGSNTSVGLYDGVTWVEVFQNSNPNFTVKHSLQLTNVSTAYSMDTCPNSDSATNGEAFKLIPTTLNNLYHHFTQKALSQLPIVSSVDVVDANRKVQIKSKLLGSEGAVEIVGGRANLATFNLIEDSQRTTYSGTDYLTIKIDAFPNTLNIGHSVEFTNPSGVKRLSRLGTGDTIDVVNVSDGVFEYRYNSKATYITPYTKLSIADISATYSRPSGTVWRWTHDDSGSNYTITDKTVGSAVVPATSNASGSAVAQNLQAAEVANSSSVAHSFTITVSGHPTQGDFYYFTSETGATFAIWFNVDSAGTAPTATNYTSATNKIQVDILSTDSPNQVITKLANVILADGSAAVTALIALFNSAITQGATFSAAKAGDLLVAFTDFKTPISTIVVSSGSATATTAQQHLLNAGDSVSVYNTTTGLYGTFTVATVPTRTSFTFATSAADGTYTGGTVTGWSAGNWSRSTGDNEIAGLPIINVDANGTYVDVVNSNGQAMSSIAVGLYGNVQVMPTPAIRWNLKHSAKTQLLQVNVSSGLATVTSVTPHNLRVGDTFVLADNQATPSVATVITVLDATQFVYSTAATNGVYSGGNVIQSTKVITRYKVEKLGFNGLMRLSCVNGDSPAFLDCGTAVDDILVVQGSTFNANNNGRYRILGVDNTSILFKNDLAKEELNTAVQFNNGGVKANWTNSSPQITGIAGVFENLAVGMWVKKPEDDDTQYRQVTAFDTGVASTAVTVTLGSSYDGTTGAATGIGFNTSTGVQQGIYLQDVSDLQVLEGDSAAIGDTLFVASAIDANWFKTVNSGSYVVNVVGTDAVTNKTFLRVSNTAGIAQTAVQISVDTAGFFIIEGANNKFSTTRQVAHIAIDEFNANRRTVYLTPAGREYKFSQGNSTQIMASSKIGFNQVITQGIDGYLYYTGLMRTVQRIVDGFAPDPDNYPGRRAIGGVIELLPPLQKRISASIQVTTSDGVNLSEISNQIKSSVITYVDSLNVAEDVILSEIIVRIMSIKGVQAATFNTPAPSTERIHIASNEKAYLDPSDISIV